MYKGKLEKISELENAEYPNNVPVGEIIEGVFDELPEEGKCFFIVGQKLGLSRKTSLVQNILEMEWDNYIFETINSKYKLTYELA